MKQQEIMDKLLREKLEGAEMEPPAALFDQISARLDRPALMPWYRKPVVLRAAAAVALLLVSTTLVLNNWNSTAPKRDLAGLATYDSLKQEQLQQQLRSMELAATQLQARVQEEEKKSSPVQPRPQSLRLASVTVENAEATIRENMTTLPVRAVNQIRTTQLPLKVQGKVAAPALFATAEEEEGRGYGLLPQISKSYSKLADGSLFELAKEKFDDFKTKEHYLSFNLGSLEIGQTIQLSKPENNEQ